MVDSDMLFRMRLFLACFLGAWISACNLSESHRPDTLTFHLGDSLKTSSGKYDSLRLDLYTLQGPDTVFARTLFHGEYRETDQLRDLSLGMKIDGGFLVRIVAFRDGVPVLEVGVPFSKEGRAGEPRIYRSPSGISPKSHSPYIVSGLEGFSLNTGESRKVVLKAKDEDGDPIHFQVQNLDSLLALFPVNAIHLAMDGDSLVLDFSPGPIEGNFRFRVALIDPSLPPVVEYLIFSVGAVNRPPSIGVQGPVSGRNFLVKEGETINLMVTAHDPDSGDNAALLALEKPPWPNCGQGGYDTASGILTFTPSFRCVSSGESTLSTWVFKAADQGMSPEIGQTEVRITVRDSNSAPKWKSSSMPVFGREGEEISLDLSANYLGDDERDPVQFSVDCGSMDSKTLRWTFSPGFRDAGKMECKILVQDAHIPPGIGSLLLNLTIADSIRQVDVAIVSPVRGWVTNDTMVIVKWKVGDQGQQQDTLEILRNEGANVIHRSYKDTMERVGSDSIVVFRDTEAPFAPMVDSDAPTPTNNPRPSWRWKTGGNGGSGYFRYKLGDTVWASNGSQGEVRVFIPESDLPEGKQFLYVEERDVVGNWSLPARFAVETDYTPPSMPILSSTTGFHTMKQKPTWQWSTGGGGGIGAFRYKLDDPDLGTGAIFSSENSYLPSLSFAIGTSHTLYVEEQDQAGNWSKAASYRISIHGLVGYGISGSGILGTKDGGVSWDTVSRPSNIQLNSVWFHNPYNGIVVGDSGVMFSTGDGGHNWQKIPIGSSQNLYTIFFPNRETGFIGGSGGLFSSRDGGSNWNSSYSNSGKAIISIHFATDAHGIAVGAGVNGSRGSISTTSDSGKNWAVSVKEAAYGLVSSYSIDPNTMICVGNSGSILRTADGGKTWKEMKSGTSVYLTSVVFINPSKGFASGENGTLLKTADGGENWVPVPIDYPTTLSHLFFLDEKIGFAAGPDILRTADGGVSWSKISLPGWVDHPLPQYPDLQMVTLAGCSRIFFP